MLYLDTNTTDEEARDFIDTNRVPSYNPQNARGNYPTYPFNTPVADPTNTIGHHPSQTRDDYPSNSTNYSVSDASVEELRVINRSGANSRFHSIQRFEDGSAW
ncbi:hypothetical protein MMC18_007082, partial [Xylographa bjoerkii]|nr:hypothetical protein [Xylographa bjoerkii]